MGLGFSTSASLIVKRGGLLRRAQGVSRDQLRDACVEYVRGTPVEALIIFRNIREGADGFALSLHPAEEDIEFVFGSDRVFTSAKTSSAGPGYHAFAIGLLDHLVARLGIEWQFGIDDDHADDTGYVQHRDFTRLQDEMVRFLSQLARVVIEHDGDSMRIGMPIDYRLIENLPGAAVLTQLGPLSRADLDACMGADDAAKRQIAKRYFAWWEEGFAANFFLKLALQHMWMSESWTAPADDAEHDEAQQCLSWLGQARRLAPSLSLPEREMAELTRLLGNTGEPVLASPTGIGYRRRMFRHDLPGPWTINTPGCLREVVSDDLSESVFALSDFSVQGSSLTADFAPGAARAHDETVGEALFEDSELRGEFRVRAAGDGTGFILSGNATAPSDGKTVETAIVTVWFLREELRPLAERVFRSLRFKPPKQSPLH